jgi:hypothetical protein
METRHSNARLSICGIRYAPAFVVKGDASTFVMEDGMGDAPTFVLKETCP